MRLKSVLDKLRLNFAIIKDSFFYGLKGADNAILSSAKRDTDGLNEEQEKRYNNVYASLVRGEITEEVEKLRYRMYKAEEESYRFRYDKDTDRGKEASLAIKEKYSDVEEVGDDMVLQLVQKNEAICWGVIESIRRYRKKGDEIPKEWLVNIDRDYVPCKRLEEYCEKIVVKRYKREEKGAVIDFYTSKYEAQFDRRHKPFLNEVEKLKADPSKARGSELTDMNKVSFITRKCRGVPDNRRFVYSGLKFVGVSEFEGSYILRFTADVEVDGECIFEKYINKEALKEYAENAPKGKTFDISYEIHKENQKTEGEKEK